MPRQQPAPSLTWTWFLWAVLAVLFVWQPNYQWQQARTSPYGSDYLQEWVGGRMVLKGDTERLYDWDYSTQLQHDRDVVGYDIASDNYFPMVYPPYWYIACAPLSALPLKWAAPIWLSLLTAAWFFGLRYAARSDGRLGRALARTPQLGLVAGPMLLTMAMGQKAGLITLIVLLTAVLLEQKRFRTAGLVCGLIAFKPHFALLIGIPLILRFGLPFLTGCLVTGLGWALLTVAVDPTLFGEFLNVALQSLSGEYAQHGGYRLDDAHNWTGFWSRLFGLGATAQTLTRIWSLGTLAVVAFVAVRRFGQRVTAAEWAVFVIGLLLASPHLYGYDLAILLMPAWWVIRELDTNPARAITVGAIVWWTLTVLPHLGRETAVPVQWSVVLLGGLFALATLHATTGLHWLVAFRAKVFTPRRGVA